MKNFITLLLTIFIMLSLTACDTAKDNVSANENSGATTSSTESRDSTSNPQTLNKTKGESTTSNKKPSSTNNFSGDILSDEKSKAMSFQTLVSKYSGKWYLDGYCDVYLDIYLKADANNSQNDILNITTTNFALPDSKNKDGYVYPDLQNLNGYSTGVGIIRNQYDHFKTTSYVRNYKISFDKDCVYIGSHKFVTTQGNKSRATGITLNKTSLELCVGESETLIATVFPDGAINKKVKWYSPDNSTVTVSSNGKVTAIAASTIVCGITATTEDGNYVATCDVFVKDNNVSSDTNPPATNSQPVRVSGVQINKTTLYLKVGDTQQLTATVSPSNANNKSIIWSSSNSSVIHVSSTGKITAKGSGSAIITVTTVDGNYTSKCTVTVANTTTTEPISNVLIISNIQTISNQTIDTDVYITSTGIATFNNVTVNGNIYCYGQLKCSACTADNVYGYAYGSMMSCGSFDGTHGKVSGGISCDKMTILDNALDYAFSKWGKK